MGRRRPIPRLSGWVALLLVTAAVVTGAAIAQVWTHLQVIQYGYKISTSSKQRAALLETNRRLRIEVALLKNPARVAKLAAHYGLRPAEPEQLRRVRLGQPATKPARAPALAHQRSTRGRRTLVSRRDHVPLTRVR